MHINTWIAAASRDINRLFFKYYRVKYFSHQILPRWDSPLINYSVFCHPRQPYSALPVY